MSDQFNVRELNEDEREFFPDYDSPHIPNTKPKKKKMGVLAMTITAATAVAVFVLALVPYVICHPLSIGETAASISARVLNVQEEAEVSYLVMESPGMPDEKILEALSENPDWGVPFPQNGILNLSGLKPKTGYKLVFYTKGEAAAEKPPALLDDYSFKTGPVPVPAFLKWIQDLFGSGNEQPDPMPSTQPVDTEPTEPTQTQPVRPTQPTQPMPPTEPAQPPAVGTVQPGQPVVNIADGENGRFVFSVQFPFTMENVTASRAEVTISRTNRDSSSVTAAPIPVSITQTGNNAVIQLDGIEVPLSESIRIIPTVYYQDRSGIETAVPGIAYEARPAGFDENTRVLFHFEIMGDAFEYLVNLENIQNSLPKHPEHSELIVESMEFVFLDGRGDVLGDPLTLKIAEAAEGETFRKSGKIADIPPRFYDARDVAVKISAVWKIDGKAAVHSDTTPVKGKPIIELEAAQPFLADAKPVAESSSTDLQICFPYKVRGVYPEKVRVQVTGSKAESHTIEGELRMDAAGGYQCVIPYRIAPGETVHFGASLHYWEEDILKTTESPVFTISSPDISTATGKLNCTYLPDHYMDYQAELRDISSMADGNGSSLKITEVSMEFTPTAGGPSVTVHDYNAGQGVSLGKTDLQKTGKVDLRDVPTGTYHVSISIRARWILNGAEVQDMPTGIILNYADPVEVQNTTYQVLMPEPLVHPDLQIVPMGIGVADAAGNVSYHTDSIRARPDEWVYVKLLLTGHPEVACEIGELTLHSQKVPNFSSVPGQPNLPVFSAGIQDERIEYVYRFMMPAGDVSDISVQRVNLTSYVPISVNPEVIDSSGMNASKGIYFRKQPVITGDIRTGSNGKIYARNGGKVQITAEIGVGIPKGQAVFVELADPTSPNGPIRLGSHCIENYLVENADGSLTDGAESITYELNIDASSGILYKELAFMEGASTM